MDLKVDQNTVVVFDLDDTLYNEIDFLKSAYKYIANTIEPGSWQKLYAQMFSLYRNGENVFDFLVQCHGQSKENLLETYRNHFPDIEPFPGVIELFNRIKSYHGKIAIITDGRSLTQQNKIKALGIEPLVDFRVISEEIGSEKPNQKNFLAVEEYFKRSSYFYIADNVKKDFDAPKALKWKCILLKDNGLNIHPYNNLQQKIQDFELDVLIQIDELNVIGPSAD